MGYICLIDESWLYMYRWAKTKEIIEGQVVHQEEGEGAGAGILPYRASRRQLHEEAD